MVLGRAIESYGDGTGQVKNAGGIDRAENGLLTKILLRSST